MATVGQLFVEIASKGFEKVQGQLGKLRDGLVAANARFLAFGQQLGNISNVAAGAFVAAKASIIGLVSQADPRGFQDLQFALAQVAIQLGRFFIPL